jgi:putative transposase
MAHYLTFSCVNRWPLLARDRTCQWFLAAMVKARQRHAFDVYGYVIMPEHAHLLVRPRGTEYDIDRFLYDIKRPVAWRAKQWLVQEGQAEWLRRLTVAHGRRSVFRFWLPGGGYDRAARSLSGAEKIVHYIHGNPV